MSCRFFMIFLAFWALSSAAGLFIEINLPLRGIFTKTAVTDPRFKAGPFKTLFYMPRWLLAYRVTAHRTKGPCAQKFRF